LDDIRRHIALADFTKLETDGAVGSDGRQQKAVNVGSRFVGGVRRADPAPG